MEAQGQTLHLTVSPRAEERFSSRITLTATLDATGLVTFYDGTVILGASPLSHGTAILTSNLLPSGIRKLKAYYSGDTKYPHAFSKVTAERVRAVGSSNLVTAEEFRLDDDPAALVVADWNGDGIQDCAATNRSGGITIFIGKGDGTSNVPESTLPESVRCRLRL